MSAFQNIEFLTPGSVWIRPKDGRTAKFLFLTNGNLPAAVQLKHPQQVIYSDEEGSVYSRGLDDFFRIYSFLNVDGDLEKRLETLLRFDAAALSNVKDDDDEPTAPVAETMPEPVEEAKPVSRTVTVKAKTDVVKSEPKTLADELYNELTNKKQALLRVRFAVSKNEALQNPELTAADLEAATVMYAAQPDEKYDMTVHKLIFRLGGKVTEESLREVFHPSNEVNTVDAFQVNTRYGAEEIVWDSWIGVFPEYSVNGLFAVVHVGSTDSPIDTQDTPGVEAVTVTHEINHESTQVPDLTDINSLLNPAIPAGLNRGTVEIPSVEIMEAAPAPVETVMTTTDSTPVVAEPQVTLTTPQETVTQPVVQPVAPVTVGVSVQTPAPVVESAPVPVTPVVQPVQMQQVTPVVQPVVADVAQQVRETSAQVVPAPQVGAVNQQ